MTNLSLQMQLMYSYFSNTTEGETSVGENMEQTDLKEGRQAAGAAGKCVCLGLVGGRRGHR